jgi:hypothetical protein
MLASCAAGSGGWAQQPVGSAANAVKAAHWDCGDSALLAAAQQLWPHADLPVPWLLPLATAASEAARRGSASSSPAPLLKQGVVACCVLTCVPLPHIPARSYEDWRLSELILTDK